MVVQRTDVEFRTERARTADAGDAEVIRRAVDEFESLTDEQAAAVRRALPPVDPADDESAA